MKADLSSESGCRRRAVAGSADAARLNRDSCADPEMQSVSDAKGRPWLWATVSHSIHLE